MVNKRFLVNLAAVLFPLLVALGLVWSQAQSTEAERRDARALTMAKSVAGAVDRLLQLRMQETFALAALPSMRGLVTADPLDRAARATVALHEMQALVAADAQVREVIVLDARGLAILTTGKGILANWSMRPFVASALAGKLDASAPSRDGGEFSTYYASPILGNSGEVAGALVLRVAAQELWQTVFAANESACCYAVLTDANGVRLADAGDPARNLRSWGPLDPALAARLTASAAYGAETDKILSTDAAPVARALAQPTPPAILDTGSVRGPLRALTLKPWTVLAVESGTTDSPISLLTFAVALVCALAAAFGLTLWQARAQSA